MKTLVSKLKDVNYLLETKKIDNKKEPLETTKYI